MSRKKNQKWSKKELDSAFEKFLQESVSDESFDGERYRANSSKVKEDLPWWMTDDDKDTSIGANKWLKPKKQSTPLKEEEEPEHVSGEQKKFVKTGSRPGGDAEVAMSRDSLDERMLSSQFSQDVIDSCQAPYARHLTPSHLTPGTLRQTPYARHLMPRHLTPGTLHPGTIRRTPYAKHFTLGTLCQAPNAQASYTRHLASRHLTSDTLCQTPYAQAPYAQAPYARHLTPRHLMPDTLHPGTLSYKSAIETKKSDVLVSKSSLDESLTHTDDFEGPEKDHLSSTGPGAETLAEIADKERFFKELEENNKGRTIDFGKLNAEADSSKTLNMTAQQTKLEASNNLTTQKRDSKKKLDSSNSSIEESSPEVKSNKGKNPSMLSKVALLDTGESTLIDKLGGTRGKDGKRSTGNSKKNSPEIEDEGNVLKQDLLNAGTGTQIEALHAALKKASGDSVGQGSETEEDDSLRNPHSRTVEDILREVQEDRQRHQVLNSSDDEAGTRYDVNSLFLTQNETGHQTQYDTGFGLPSIPERDTSNGAFSLQPATQDENNRGFSLQPATLDEDDNRGFSLQPSNTDNSGFSLQPATQDENNRGFSLQPAILDENDRGFSLQPATLDENDGRGFSLQPATRDDYESGFSLRPASQVPSSDRLITASADDEDSFNNLLSTSKPHKKGTKGKYDNVKSSGYGQPKLKSTTAWSPAQVTKQKVKGSEVGTKSGRTRAGDKNLVESVQSFAHYIQDHFSRGKKSPPPEWSNNEPNLSASLMDSKIQIISRERALVAEVAEWQQRWKEEQRQNWKLKAEIASKEREFNRKNEETKLHHEKEMFKLKQDNFVLQAKINSEEDQNLAKKRLMSGRSVDENNKEEIKMLHKEVIEQETLLQGYQQENERLYSEVKRYQAITKDTEERLFKENQKLNTDIGNLREELERKELALRHKGIITSDRAQHDIRAGATAVLGAGRIAQLEAEAVEAKIVESELKHRVRLLKDGENEIKKQLELMIRERNQAQNTIQAMQDDKINEFQGLQKHYDEEVEKLKKKLKWYAENQDLLDKDYQSLKEKDEELKMLKSELDNYRKEKNQKNSETQRRAKERAADARRIQDLQRQVREMEEIIKKRYPNSLPALIYAAASAPGQAQDDGVPKVKSHTMSYLENRVHKLEEELEEKDEEAKRGLRVMEQKFNNIKIQYEDRIKQLESQLSIYTTNPSAKSHPHTSVTVLQKELLSIKDRYKVKIQKMELEMEAMQKKITAGKESSNRSEPYKTPGAQSSQLKQLINELDEKNHEIELLKGTCDRLMKERVGSMTAMATNEPVPTKGSKKGKKSTSDTDVGRQLKVYQPNNFAGLHISDVIQENEQLREQCNTLSIGMEQQRLKLQAALAESECAIRHAREHKMEEIQQLNLNHRKEIERVVSEAAIKNSESVNVKLKSKVEAQEVSIKHLQHQLSSLRIDADALAVARIQEESLKVQIEHLSLELKEAKACHSPQMKHFEALQAKIIAMETRHLDREKEMKNVMEKTQETLMTETNQKLTTYQQLLLDKNNELQRFRAELDSILDVLKELQRQGVVIPTLTSNSNSLLM
ncbi:centrosomal protein of 162 kDa-like [Antedon mediterranea]|uniref:centrosomal protein of 162 kDa-like n=1 Tax=Antedon mediterranea TaxID=105859 RepID=UPI003AF96C89